MEPVFVQLGIVRCCSCYSHDDVVAAWCNPGHGHGDPPVKDRL